MKNKARKLQDMWRNTRLSSFCCVHGLLLCELSRSKPRIFNKSLPANLISWASFIYCLGQALLNERFMRYKNLDITIYTDYLCFTECSSRDLHRLEIFGNFRQAAHTELLCNHVKSLLEVAFGFPQCITPQDYCQILCDE